MNVKHLQSLARYNSWTQTFLEYFARKHRKSWPLIWSCQLVGSTQYLASFQYIYIYIFYNNNNNLKKKKKTFLRHTFIPFINNLPQITLSLVKLL